MTRDEAQALAVRIFASYPGYHDDSTMAMYVERIGTLDDAGRAYDAVTECIDHFARLPSISDIRQAYKQAKPSVPELEADPVVTDEERAANLARVRAMSAALADGMGFEEAWGAGA